MMKSGKKLARLSFPLLLIVVFGAAGATADPFSGVTGSDITADVHWTYSIALGDMDGDGDLDLVAGNDPEVNRLYLNNGTADPFNGVTGSDITADVGDVRSVVLGDVDGDGDLDLVTGNIGRNRLYLNNGTADPFNGVTGSNITDDSYNTYSVVLGDVDGDGDLDLIAGNFQTNRLYLNNSTADPFNGVTGSHITLDVSYTYSVILGDVDGDGDLDLIAGNDVGQPDRLYLNNGTADPFNGVTGSNITAYHPSLDSTCTSSAVLGDVDGDGDLDLILGTGIGSQTNRLYLNNGTADPFNGVTGSDITTDATWTYSIALGDMDGDGDLDLIAGNDSRTNRLYLNNGTADPFNDITGSDITADTDWTFSVALGDMDGDGDLDLVAGNTEMWGTNRLYKNDISPTTIGSVNPTSGDLPLLVTFKITGNSEPDDNNLDYYFDYDGDGDFDEHVMGADEAQVTTTYLYTAAGSYIVKIKVVDSVSDLAVEDTSTVISVTQPLSLQAWLVQPKIGDTIGGEAVTLHANTAPGSETKRVKFQYNDGAWQDIGPWITPPQYSFMTTWNVFGLVNGSYDVRVVAEDNDSNTVNSDVVTVTVDNADPDNTEGVSAGKHRKRKIVSKDKTEVVGIYDGTEIEVLCGAIAVDSVVDIKLTGTSNNAANGAAAGKTDIGATREFSIDGVTEPLEAIIIKIPYPDTDNDGKVDGTSVKETTLKVYWYDETAEEWALALSSEVNTTENYITAQVAHLSEFGVFGDSISSDGGGGGGGCFLSTTQP